MNDSRKKDVKAMHLQGEDGTTVTKQLIVKKHTTLFTASRENRLEYNHWQITIHKLAEFHERKTKCHARMTRTGTGTGT